MGSKRESKDIMNSDNLRAVEQALEKEQDEGMDNGMDMLVIIIMGASKWWLLHYNVFTIVGSYKV